jgi:hypothetical protein
MAPTVGKVERSEADIAPPPFGSAVIKRLHGSVVSHYPLAPYEHRQAAVQDRLRCCEIRGASARAYKPEVSPTRALCAPRNQTRKERSTNPSRPSADVRRAGRVTESSCGCVGGSESSSWKAGVAAPAILNPDPNASPLRRRPGPPSRSPGGCVVKVAQRDRLRRLR